MQHVVTLACEGQIDSIILTRAVEHFGMRPGSVYVKGGKDALDRQLNGYVQAAAFDPWIVLRDLDQDGDCAPELLRAKLDASLRGRQRQASYRLCMIVAVRQIEAWLLADRSGIASFLGVSIASVPEFPEAQPDSKATLVGLARRSRRRVIREGMVPTESSGRSVGTGYTNLIQQFVMNSWNIDAAVQVAASLAKLKERITRFQNNGMWERS